MATRNTPQRKRNQTAVAVVDEAKSSSKAKAKASDKAEGALGEIKDKINSAVEGVRESSRESMLAGLGLIARVRQQRNERMAELVEEGKRFEPEVKQAIDNLKAKIQIKGELKDKFDLSKLKFDAKKFDREALKARLGDGMTSALHRMGLATHKEVDVLAKQVNKLAEMQDA